MKGSCNSIKEHSLSRQRCITQALSAPAPYAVCFGTVRQHLLTGQFLRSGNGFSLFWSLTQLIAYDATEEDESALDADSQQVGLSQEHPAAPRSLVKHISREWADKSHGQDSSEVDSKQRDRSLENDSRQKFDSHEADDDSKAGVREDSHHSMESRESQVRVSAEIPDDNSNQTLESAEDARDRHSIENNEVTL